MLRWARLGGPGEISSVPFSAALAPFQPLGRRLQAPPEAAHLLRGAASGREVSPGLGAGCCGPAWRASARIQGGHCGLHKPGEAWPPPPPGGAAALKKQAAGDAISGPTLCRPRKSQSPSLCAALKTAGFSLLVDCVEYTASLLSSVHHGFF